MARGRGRGTRDQINMPRTTRVGREAVSPPGRRNTSAKVALPTFENDIFGKYFSNRIFITRLARHASTTTRVPRVMIANHSVENDPQFRRVPRNV